MKEKKYKKKNSKGLFSRVATFVVVVTVIGCGVKVAFTKVQCAEMSSELSAIKAKTDELEAENVELQRILDGGDMNAYMEKVAIENMNYAYPNERRYYDTSRN